MIIEYDKCATLDRDASSLDKRVTERQALAAVVGLKKAAEGDLLAILSAFWSLLRCAGCRVSSRPYQTMSSYPDFRVRAHQDSVTAELIGDIRPATFSSCDSFRKYCCRSFLRFSLLYFSLFPSTEPVFPKVGG